MAGERAGSIAKSRGQLWAWWVSLLLLLATMLNYMDRQALSVMSNRITDELQISNEQYGDLEFGFGVAFAAGSLVFGAIADRCSVRWLYPGVLLAWSAMGVLTAWCSSFQALLVCRVLLGFFESGHWPCALRTTKTIQTGSQRLMGNSILQSGGALGAIVTPLLVLAPAVTEIAPLPAAEMFPPVFCSTSLPAPMVIAPLPPVAVTAAASVTSSAEVLPLAVSEILPPSLFVTA